MKSRFFRIILSFVVTGSLLFCGQQSYVWAQDEESASEEDTSVTEEATTEEVTTEETTEPTTETSATTTTPATTSVTTAASTTTTPATVTTSTTVTPAVVTPTIVTSTVVKSTTPVTAVQPVTKAPLRKGAAVRPTVQPVAMPGVTELKKEQTPVIVKPATQPVSSTSYTRSVETQAEKEERFKKLQEQMRGKKTALGRVAVERKKDVVDITKTRQMKKIAPK
jgi:hypothetical protein